MSILQRITIERGYLPGPVDFTKYAYNFGAIQMRRNEPTLFDFTVTYLPDLGPWFKPTRGDYVRFEDFRWEQRYASVSPGLVFSGYITVDPQLEFLGVKDQQQQWGYKLKCTSEDYLINSKRVPARTFINKPRGQILKELLQEMFEDSDVFPFDLSHMHDGGIERIYRTDPARYWTELAADFGKSDGFVYMVLDHQVFYVPEMSEPVPQGNYDRVLAIDELDPRYTPSNLDIKPVEASIVNDLTVIGENEPTTVCFEQFVSDGYQPNFELTYVPYGLEETSLIIDDLGSEIDETIWEEKDDAGVNYIQAFEGSLNVVGGPGVDTGLAFLRSRKGIELSGIVTFRDGEVFFPPSPTGTGIIGGLYTADTCREADLWAGWYIDMDANHLTPRGPSGVTLPSMTINPLFEYVLRRVVTVDRFAGLPRSVVDQITGHRYDEDVAPTTATIAWSVDTVDATDPDNVEITTTQLGTMTATNPQFVLYAAIVPYSCHLVMNSISVTKPQQVHVVIDEEPEEDVESHIWTLGPTPIIVGSALDGGRCLVEQNGTVAKLSWFSLPSVARAAASADEDTTTIPPRGSTVGVRYYRSDLAKARIRSNESIQTERAKFKDDGVRQLTLAGSDVTPAPRTSEECLFIARAFLADRLRSRYEGTYNFITSENDDRTLLTSMVLPGDKLLCTIDTPDGEIQEILDVENVTVSIVGTRTYQISLAFGPVNRYDIAIRELLRRRHSSLQEVVIPQSEVYDADLLNSQGFSEVPDPVPPTVTVVGPDYIVVSFGPGPMQPGITGYECRAVDAGWGLGGHIVRFDNAYYRGFDRKSRQVKYFFRSYLEVDSVRTYSKRSALVRHVFPMGNRIALRNITTEWSNEGGYWKFFVPMSPNPDWAKIRVRAGGDDLYIGDGIDNNYKLDHLNVYVNDGNIEIQVKDLSGGTDTSYTLTVLAIDVLGREADNDLEVSATCLKRIPLKAKIRGKATVVGNLT